MTMEVGVNGKLHLVRPCQVCGRNYSALFDVWLPAIMCCGLPLSLVQIEVQDGTEIGTGADYQLPADTVIVKDNGTAWLNPEIGTSADSPHIVEGGS